MLVDEAMLGLGGGGGGGGRTKAAGVMEGGQTAGRRERAGNGCVESEGGYAECKATGVAVEMGQAERSGAGLAFGFFCYLELYHRLV